MRGNISELVPASGQGLCLDRGSLHLEVLESRDVPESDPQASIGPQAPASPSSRYLLGEALGGGAKGIVQKALDPVTGQHVAIKSVQSDKDCPVRFLQLTVHGREVLSAEGLVPVKGESFQTWSGSLAFDADNPYGAIPFAGGCLKGSVVLLRRGGATFAEKVSSAQAGGAVGVIFVNRCDDLEACSLGDTSDPFPCLLIALSDGDAAIELAGNVDVKAQVLTDVGHELLVCKSLPRHPNIIKVIDAWENRETGVVVMELCSGGRLPVDCSVTAALALTRQLLEGLHCLHEHNICHRDVKPENLLLSHPPGHADSRLVLVDFSMASMASKMYVSCGSRKYLAPEVLKGSYGFERDVWSAGIVAYVLVCGRHPFGRLSDNEVVARLQNPDCRNPVSESLRTAAGTEVPQMARDLLHGLLEIEPRERLTTAQALAHPVFLQSD